MLSSTEAARALGSIKTEKKTAASRQNMAKAMEAARVARGTSACTCDRPGESDPMKHRGQCRRYQAEYRRRSRAAKNNS